MPRWFLAWCSELDAGEHRISDDGCASPEARSASEATFAQEFEDAGAAAMEQLGGTLYGHGWTIELRARELGGHVYLGRTRRGARRPRAWSPMPMASQTLW